jgi:hypothetical protein
MHAILKLLQATARSIDSRVGGGDLGHIGLIVSTASCTVVSVDTAWADP